MHVLVTSSRMPFALDLIRKLGKRGHSVFAADTFKSAPGSHSKYVAEALVVPSPRYHTEAFVAAVAELIESRNIDLLLPSFEESIHLARHADRLPARAKAFFAPFATQLRLHNKLRFLSLAHELGLRTPRTTMARSRDELAEAVGRHSEYFARPTYSRGGVALFTNTGPLAGALALDECQPTTENPWVVQEFVHGTDVCSYSVVHDGRVAAHSSYVHPRELEHAGGIVFESVDEPEALSMTRRVVEAVAYTGQIALDFMKDERGLTLIECNPRATSGVTLLSAEQFERALFHPEPGVTFEAPPGVKRKISVALIRDMVLHREEAGEDLSYLLSSAPDLYAQRGDLLPALYQLISYGHVAKYRRQLDAGAHKRSLLMEAYFHDILFDGEASREP